MVFCEKCQKEMASGQPFDGSEGVRVNFILHFGTALLGESERCDKCHSYISTKWFVVLLPVFPLASYRLSSATNLKTGKTTYSGRQVELHKPHLFAMLAVYFGLFLCLLYGLFA